MTTGTDAPTPISTDPQEVVLAEGLKDKLLHIDRAVILPLITLGVTVVYLSQIVQGSTSEDMKNAALLFWAFWLGKQ